MCGVFMNSSDTVTCWSAARWTIAGALLVVALVWFFGGFDASTVEIAG